MNIIGSFSDIVDNTLCMNCHIDVPLYIKNNFCCKNCALSFALKHIDIDGKFLLCPCKMNPVSISISNDNILLAGKFCSRKCKSNYSWI